MEKNKKEPSLLPLPEVDSTEYLNVLRMNTIEAFRFLLNDSLALDYAGVEGKYRALVIGDKNYKTTTRQLRAAKFLDELEEVDSISKSLASQNEENDELSYNSKVKGFKPKQTKEDTSLRLRAAEIRRNLLSFSKTENTDENLGINFFFVPITKEDLLLMRDAEIREDEEAELTAQMEAEQLEQKSQIALAKKTVEVLQEREKKSGYYVANDGSVSDW
jgi:hypothetical protein